jgi:glycosyltransferase involved in cell wall biosynthesis
MPGTESYSETFIVNQLARMPGTVVPIYGEFPYCTWKGEPLVPGPMRLLRREGQRIHPLIQRLASEAAERKMSRFLRRWKIDVILAQYATTAVSLLAVSQRAGVSLVAHFHGCDAYESNILAEYADGYRRLFAQASALICVSEAMREKLLELGAPGAKLFVNPCGIDVDHFSPADAAGNPPVFVAVGRFVEKKAPLLTLLAFQRVVQECPQARLVMAGDGPLLEVCRQTVRALGMKDSVSLRGRLTPAEVIKEMGAGRAFVQHSVVAGSGDSEGTPVAILEAGARALPVVSTRHGGIRQAVVDGETGFLVEEGDIDGMAAAMLRLAGDPELAGEMGRRAREHITRYYSLERRIETLLSILREAAAERKVSLPKLKPYQP